MSEERLKEIKDMIDSDYDFCRKFGIDFAIPEKELELYNEVISLQKRNKEIYDGFLATQEELTDYAEENEKLKSRIEKAINKVQYIIDIGFDYDGYNDLDNLKILVDELVDLARQTKNILNGRSDE